MINIKSIKSFSFHCQEKSEVFRRLDNPSALARAWATWQKYSTQASREPVSRQACAGHQKQRLTQGTGPALLQEFPVLRGQGSHLGDQPFPGCLQAAPAQIIEAIRMPKRGTEPEEAVIAYREAPPAGAAVEEMVAAGLGAMRPDQGIAALFQGLKAFRVGLLDGGDLLRGEALAPDFRIPAASLSKRRCKCGSKRK